MGNSTSVDNMSSAMRSAREYSTSDPACQRIQPWCVVRYGCVLVRFLPGRVTLCRMCGEKDSTNCAELVFLYFWKKKVSNYIFIHYMSQLRSSSLKKKSARPIPSDSFLVQVARESCELSQNK